MTIDKTGCYAVSMELIARIASKEIWLEILNRPYEFHPSLAEHEFVCILFANDPTITSAEQAQISEQLVTAGCHYAVCAGIESSSWDDSVDWAYLATNADYSPPDETMVMTTWHQDESPEEIISFGLYCTNFALHEFSRYVILMIGPNPDLEKEIRRIVLKEANDVS